MPHIAFLNDAMSLCLYREVLATPQGSGELEGDSSRDAVCYTDSSPEQSAIEASEAEGRRASLALTVGGMCTLTNAYATSEAALEVEEITPASPLSTADCSDRGSDQSPSPTAAEAFANATMLASVVLQGDGRQQGLTLDEAAEMSQVSHYCSRAQASSFGGV